jgi:hypothetical protein
MIWKRIIERRWNRKRIAEPARVVGTLPFEIFLQREPDIILCVGGRIGARSTV